MLSKTTASGSMLSVRMPRKMARQTLERHAGACCAGSRPYLGSGLLGSPENRYNLPHFRVHPGNPGLRRSGLTEPIWAARHAAAGPCWGGGAAHGGYRVHSSESRVLRGNFCESKWVSAVRRGQDWPVLRASNRASPSSADKGANSDQFLQRQEQTSPTLNCRRASTSFQGGYGT